MRFNPRLNVFGILQQKHSPRGLPVLSFKLSAQMCRFLYLVQLNYLFYIATTLIISNKHSHYTHTFMMQQPLSGFI